MSSRSLLLLLLPLFLGACVTTAPRPTESASTASCPACTCPACPGTEPAKAAEKPMQPADWGDLPGWGEDDLAPTFEAFLASCSTLEKRALWKATCAAARQLEGRDGVALRDWFQTNFRPWAAVNPDGSREGMITGYYEPVLNGSRKKKTPYLTPVFGPPDDMIVVDMAELYPELKHLRLRGRLEGRKLVPYLSRAEWSKEESKRSRQALLWVDDPIDFFFMQIQGSGQIAFSDGSRVRLNYADQNGHPYRSIGRWLVEQGELKAAQASMQNIKAWAKANPGRLQEMLDVNPSVVFFRELPAEGSGPQGALGVPLTPARSVAIDPRHLTLGAPVFVATTWPNESRPLRRLMLAQDTGGAIRGVVRADFYWGSGPEAGAQAGKMRQQGRLWQLLPRDTIPEGAPR
jgi:membrane-bound lytic murein transglycosylase A